MRFLNGFNKIIFKTNNLYKVNVRIFQKTESTKAVDNCLQKLLFCVNFKIYVELSTTYPNFYQNSYPK